MKKLDYNVANSVFLTTYIIIKYVSGVRSTFQCDDYSTIPAWKVCDGARDCKDGSDETSAICGQNT